MRQAEYVWLPGQGVKGGWRYFEELAGPFDGATPSNVTGTEVVLIGEAGMTWADILVSRGFFPSKSQARKAGWTGRPRPGFSLYTVGKLHRRIVVWQFAGWLSPWISTMVSLGRDPSQPVQGWE